MGHRVCWLSAHPRTHQTVIAPDCHCSASLGWQAVVIEGSPSFHESTKTSKKQRLLETLRGSHFSLREKALPLYGIPKLQRDQETGAISPTSTFSPQPDVIHRRNRKEFLTGVSQLLPQWAEGVSISALQTTVLDTKLRVSAHHSPWRC